MTQKRFVQFSSILAALIFCLAAGMAQEARPETGTMIREPEMNGLCLLDIINNGTYDAVAYLCTMQKEILSAVYVRGGEMSNLTGIEDGSYELYFRLGENWNASTARFDSNARSSRMEDTLLFRTVQTPEGMQYTWGQVTLQEIERGNEEMVDVDEEDFPT